MSRGRRTTETALPIYKPIVATLLPNPFHRDAWVYEEKIGGYRMLADKDGRRVRLPSGASSGASPPHTLVTR